MPPCSFVFIITGFRDGILALRGLNKTFYHQTVSTEQIEEYLAKKLGLDLTTFFDQYLRDIALPVFEYKLEDKVLKYRWSNCQDKFAMPIKVKVGEKWQWLMPSQTWTTHLLPEAGVNVVDVDKNFYVKVQKVD